MRLALFRALARNKLYDFAIPNSAARVPRARFRVNAGLRAGDDELEDVFDGRGRPGADEDGHAQHYSYSNVVDYTVVHHITFRVRPTPFFQSVRGRPSRKSISTGETIIMKRTYATYAYDDERGYPYDPSVDRADPNAPSTNLRMERLPASNEKKYYGSTDPRLLGLGQTGDHGGHGQGSSSQAYLHHPHTHPLPISDPLPSHQLPYPYQEHSTQVLRSQNELSPIQSRNLKFADPRDSGESEFPSRTGYRADRPPNFYELPNRPMTRIPPLMSQNYTHNDDGGFPSLEGQRSPGHNSTSLSTLPVPSLRSNHQSLSTSPRQNARKRARSPDPSELTHAARQPTSPPMKKETDLGVPPLHELMSTGRIGDIDDQPPYQYGFRRQPQRFPAPSWQKPDPPDPTLAISYEFQNPNYTEQPVGYSPYSEAYPHHPLPPIAPGENDMLRSTHSSAPYDEDWPDYESVSEQRVQPYLSLPGRRYSSQGSSSTHSVPKPDERGPMSSLLSGPPGDLDMTRRLNYAMSRAESFPTYRPTSSINSILEGSHHPVEPEFFAPSAERHRTVLPLQLSGASGSLYGSNDPLGASFSEDIGDLNDHASTGYLNPSQLTSLPRSRRPTTLHNPAPYHTYAGAAFPPTLRPPFPPGKHPSLSLNRIFGPTIPEPCSSSGYVHYDQALSADANYARRPTQSFNPYVSSLRHSAGPISAVSSNPPPPGPSAIHHALSGPPNIPSSLGSGVFPHVPLFDNDSHSQPLNPADESFKNRIIRHKFEDRDGALDFLKEQARMAGFNVLVRTSRSDYVVIICSCGRRSRPKPQTEEQQAAAAQQQQREEEEEPPRKKRKKKEKAAVTGCEWHIILFRRLPQK
ncbi:uncharacterized protein EV422DRAFT_579926 [Fimicolochytrium jonesii]|uniref:uncharacterized protein n=1 Tax=Fimicolochytrium jonesii TaxID=1396493 RepID=UPI0022FEEA81|nr:uncharacterized protein EV422DRAFT_579926 [Fimicolochytrium jonesii]KAI8818489.1 hypothetical protein EV422DRAFT_579926 [Fimicolochytrium jonesii]